MYSNKVELKLSNGRLIEVRIRPTWPRLQKISFSENYPTGYRLQIQEEGC